MERTQTPDPIAYWFDLSPDGLALFNGRGLVMVANDALGKMVGVAPEMLKGKSPIDLFPRLEPEVIKELRGVIRRAAPEAWRFGYTDLESRQRWIEVQCRKPAKRDQRQGTLTVWRDVSRAVTTEIELKESEHQFRQFFQSNAHLCYLVSPQGAILDINAKALEVLDYQREGLVGQPLIQAVYAPHAQERAKQLSRLWVETGQLRNEEMDIVTRSGEIRTVWLNGDTVRDASGQVLHATLVQTDVTEFLHVQKRLQEEQRRFRELTENIGGVFYLIDPTTRRFIEVSPACAHLWMVSEEDLRADPDVFFNAVHPDDRDAVKAAWEQEAAEEIPFDMVFRMLRGDGALRWVHTKHFPVHNEKGQVVQLAGTALDITKRMRTERLAESHLRLSQIAQEQEMRMLMQAFLDEAELLTGSQIGFFHMVDLDQKNLTLQAWSTRTKSEMCQIDSTGAHYPLGQAGVWVDAARLRRPVIHNDYPRLPHRKGLPEGHAPVIRELVVPVIRGDRVLAILGVGNKPTEYDAEDEKVLGTLADMAWDMVQRKQAEEALREQSDLLIRIAETSPVGMVVVHSQGQITFANPAAGDILGVTVETVLSRGYDDAAWKIEGVDGRPFPEERLPFCQVIDNGQAVHDVRHAIRWPDGRRVLLSINAAPLRDSSNQLVGVVMLFTDITARQAVQDQLRETKEFYEAILEGVHDGIWVTNENDVITYCNPGMAAIAGVPKDKILGRCIPSDFDEPTTGAFNAFYRQAKAVEEPIPYEVQVKTPDGRDTIQEGWLIPQRRAGGAFGIICTVHDVTEERRQATLIKEGQRRLNTLMNNLPGMAYRCLNDTQWTMELVSQGCLGLTGYPPEALMGNQSVSYNDLIHPNDRELVWKTVQKALKKKREFVLEYRIHDRSGKIKWVWEQGVAVRNERGRVEALEGFIADITDQKEALEALRASEDKHRRLFETMAQGVVYQDAQGRIIAANPAAERILGLSLDQLQRRTSMDSRWKMVLENGTQVPGSKHPAMVALKTGKKVGPVIRGIYRPDREDYAWLSITATPLFHPGVKKPFQVHATFDDITEQRRAEQNYHMLFHEMLDGFAVHEILCDEAGVPVDYRFLAVNPSFERMTGLNSEDIVGKTVLEVMPGTEAHWIEAYGKVALTGEPALFENYAAEINKHFQVTAFQPVPGQFACIFSDVTERKEFEQALRQSEQEYRRLFHEALTGNYISDRSGRILLCNDTFARMTGYESPLEVYEVSANQFYTSEKERRAMIKVLEKKKQLRQVENPLRCKDGSLMTVLENMSGVFDEQGRLQQIKGYLIDITARKAVESALEESETKYRHLFNNAPIGIFSVDHQGRILEVNDRLLKILGSPSAEETRKINIFTFPPLVEAGVSRVFQACLNSGEGADYEHHYTSKWGKESDLVYHLAPMRDTQGHIIGVQASVQDITQRKRAEKKLIDSYQELKENQKAALNLMEDLTLENEERRRAERQLTEYAAKLNSLLTAAPIGIGLVKHRIFQQVNATLCTMTLYGESEFIDQDARLLYLSDEEYQRVGEEKSRQIAQWGTGTVETQWRRKDGEVLDILLSSTPINLADWGLGVTFTALDITERKRGEARLKASLREKEMLLKEIHHRVKNNLQIINSLLNLQTMQTQDPALIQALHESRNRIYSMALVHERLYRSSDFSSISFADYIQTVIRELFSSYEITRRIELKLAVDAIDLGIDTAIPCGLMVNELITNALKHAFPGGRSGVVRVSFKRKPQGLLCLKVSDNGVGIPEGTDLSGKSSLGMQLIRVLTEQLLGSLKIHQKRGAGFTICFPEPEADIERRRMGMLEDEAGE